jgi:mxaA protein
VFSDTTDTLFKKAPSFRSIQTELNQFFALSNEVFFDGQQAANPGQYMQWLKTFCKQCRDCERGLKPAKNKAKA